MSRSPSIPLLDLARRNRALVDELLGATRTVFIGGRSRRGEQVRSLESEIARRSRLKHAKRPRGGALAIVAGGVDGRIVPGRELAALYRQRGRVSFVTRSPDCDVLGRRLLERGTETPIHDRVPLHLYSFLEACRVERVKAALNTLSVDA